MSEALRPGTVICGRYSVMELAGEPGTQATAYRCRDALVAEEVVCRVGDPTSREPFKAQYRLLRSIHDQGLVGIYGYTEEADGQPVLLLESLQGPSMQSWLLEAHPHLAERVRRYADVLSGVVSLHGAGVAHGDIHPGNIVVEGQRTVLIDPDSAQWGRSRASRTGCPSTRDEIRLNDLFLDLFTEPERRSAVLPLGTALQSGEMSDWLRLARTLQRDSRVTAAGGPRELDRWAAEDLPERRARREELGRQRRRAIDYLIGWFRTRFEDLRSTRPDIDVNTMGDVAGDPLGGANLEATTDDGDRLIVRADPYRDTFRLPWPEPFLRERLLGEGMINLQVGGQSLLVRFRIHISEANEGFLIQTRTEREAAGRIINEPMTSEYMEGCIRMFLGADPIPPP